MIVDFHTHCFSDEIAARAIPKLAKAGDVQPFTDGTVSGLKNSMKFSGINMSVVQPIATKPTQTTVINRWAASIKDAQIIPFGTIHPEYEHWQEEIIWLSKQGIKGIKFHPDYQNFFVDNERLFPIYEMLFSMNFIVLFHAGVDIAFSEPYHCTPKRLQKVLDMFPGAVLVAAHMGGYLYWEDVEKYLIGRNIYMDTSFSFEKLGKKNMERIIREHGADKILFASDSPWGDQAKEIMHIKSLGLSDKELSAILSGNACQLLANSES
jgi:predicted TIM-barrel fold metal-dependent hydrolase